LPLPFCLDLVLAFGALGLDAAFGAALGLAFGVGRGAGVGGLGIRDGRPKRVVRDTEDKGFELVGLVHQEKYLSTQGA
jgi:hypothetical protein